MSYETLPAVVRRQATLPRLGASFAGITLGLLPIVLPCFVIGLQLCTVPALAAPGGSRSAAMEPIVAGGRDWPQYRGVEGAGVARGVELAPSWPEGGPPEVFRRPIGSGFAGVAAVGGRLYTMAAEGDQEVLLALDAANGETAWQVPLGERFVSDLGDGPRATPTVVGDTVYAVSAKVRLVAVATADGSVRWSRDFPAELGAAVPRFGFSPSPLVLGDLLILEVGGSAEGQAIVALDRHTGETRWTADSGPAGAGTPILVELAGVPQLVFHRRPDLVSLSLDGEVLWRHPSALDAIVMPVALAGDRLFVSSATMGRGGVMLRVAKGDAGWQVSEEWVQGRMRNHFNTAVHWDGVLYGFDNATLRAVDAADGTLLWAARGFGKGSVLAADGKLVVYGDDGTLALVDASREAYVERGRFQATEGRSWTSPTLAGNLLVVRDHDEIAAFDVSPAAVPAAAALAAGVATAPVRPAATPAPAVELPESAEAVAERYATARGGLATWRAVEALRLRGTWATFSVVHPFVLLRQRAAGGDLYRVEHEFLGGPFLRGRDADGLWWQTAALGAPEAGPIGIEAYVPHLEREAALEPALLGWRDKGIRLELLGGGEVDGRTTVDLRLTFPQPEGAEGEPRSEVWHLDPVTALEVAVDSRVADYTQGQDPFDRRTYYGDFRPVPTGDGDAAIVIPFEVSHEFGARLEEIAVESVEVDPALPEGAFTRPPAPPEAATAAEEVAAAGDEG